MSHPTEPDQPEDSVSADAETEALPNHGPEHEPATEVFPPAKPQNEGSPVQPGERRFTAPSGFDAGSTQIINRPIDPATEAFSMGDQGPTEAFSAQKPATPQVIPPRGDGAKPPTKKRNWGWVIAIVLIIAALAAVAIVGTILLTRNSSASASQQDQVRSAIGDFDVAVQNGDLATLRTVTCRNTRDGYVRYHDAAWAATDDGVAAVRYRWPALDPRFRQPQGL